MDVVDKIGAMSSLVKTIILIYHPDLLRVFSECIFLNNGEPSLLFDTGDEKLTKTIL